MSMRTAIYDPGHSSKREPSGTKKELLILQVCAAHQYMHICLYIEVTEYVCNLSGECTTMPTKAFMLSQEYSTLLLLLLLFVPLIYYLTERTV